MLQKLQNRLRRKARVRSLISGTSERPRLSIFRTTTHIYAQIIDDVTGKTLASSSDLKIDSKASKTELAIQVGQDIGKKAQEMKIKNVVFDRGGFRYHGRVKALADAARESGLQF
ncbi:50S ribosomal protein L18 [Candidatus Gracilibacteria bacterium]|nr:50S ribosomal protein L18 [Candidatus Gracilibacteria bacterium]